MLFNDVTTLQAAAFLGVVLHVIHPSRMPTFYALKLQGENLFGFYVPHWIVSFIWLGVLCCDAAFAILFLQENIVFDGLYNAVAWIFFATVGSMIIWNWVYFNAICFYAVGFMGVLIFLEHAAMLTLAIVYGDQSWFTYLILAVPVAWTLIAGVWSVVLAVYKGPLLKEWKVEITATTIAMYNFHFNGKSTGDTSVKAHGKLWNFK